MIYTNLFKTGESHETKDKIDYLLECRKYRFTDTFSSKFSAICLGITATTLLAVALNLGIFNMAISSNDSKINSFQSEKESFEINAVDLEELQNQYTEAKKTLNTLIDIANKSPHWTYLMDTFKSAFPEDYKISAIRLATQQELLDAVGEEANGVELTNKIIKINIHAPNKENLSKLMDNVKNLDITYRVDCTNTSKLVYSDGYNITLFVVLK